MKGLYLYIGILAIAVSLHAQVPGDEHWDVRFGPSGTENTILSVLRHETNVYVSGFFSMAGGVNATNIARWDGQDWYAVGPGIGRAEGSLLLSYVYSLATDGTHIYAGGQFTNSGSLATTSSVVRWDGTNWQSVGNLRGLPGYLGFANGFLYAGGSLAVPGDTNTYAVARWDGSSWDTLGSVVRGFLDGAFNFRFEGGDVYAFGTFTNIGGVAANSAAKWSPTLPGSGWEAMGSGFTGGNVLVSGVAIHNGQLHVSGTFQNADGVPATNMAIWTGSGWAPFSGADDEVRRIHSDGTHLYAVGDFMNIGGVSARRAARWNGLQWEALGAGITPGVFDSALSGSELLVCGNFINAGSTASVACIARWDGNQWHALNAGRQNGMNLPLGVVFAMDVFDDSLYAGGTFTGAGPLLRSRIARWDGNAWSPLGEGIIGPTAHRVRAITHSPQYLYVAGTFTNIGGVRASNVARWRGLNWEALGSGMNSNVHALAWFTGSLYAGGAFTMASGMPANRLAYWSGAQVWRPLDSGLNSNVNALLVWGNSMVIGGQFTMAGGIAAHKIVEFGDFGVSWRAIGGNVIPPGGNVLALAASGSNLYVGGSFVIPGVNATNIARWDGDAWHALGGGVLGRATPINALAVRGHELFAAGTITNAGGVETRAIARWDGTNWHAMGSGFERDPGEATLSALAVFEDSIYVGGSFTRAGGRPSVGIARWVPEIPLRITGQTFGAGSVSLNAETMRGLKLRLDGSSDLGAWVPMDRVKSYSDVETLTDANPATGRRFYRVVAEP